VWFHKKKGGLPQKSLRVTADPIEKILLKTNIQSSRRFSKSFSGLKVGQTFEIKLWFSTQNIAERLH
jgi:hypothetical protein